MATVNFDSTLSGAEIESALVAIDGVIDPTHNGKVLTVQNGYIVPKSVLELSGTMISKTITENGDYYPASDNADGYSEVHVNVPSTVPSASGVSF